MFRHAYSIGSTTSARPRALRSVKTAMVVGNVNNIINVNQQYSAPSAIRNLVSSTTGTKLLVLPTSTTLSSSTATHGAASYSATISKAAAAFVMSVVMTVSTGYCFMIQQQGMTAGLEAEAKPATVTIVDHGETQQDQGDDDLLLPVYTSKDVANHNGKDGSRIWMSYGGYVYDVTDFIPNHPGGTEKILLAAGSYIEPYWDTYRQHFSSLLPLQYLEKMKIGVLDENDQQRIDDQLEKETTSPYAYEPVRHPELIIHTEQPANMETPYTQLTDSYITPSEVKEKKKTSL